MATKTRPMNLGTQIIKPQERASLSKGPGKMASGNKGKPRPRLRVKERRKVTPRREMPIFWPAPWHRKGHGDDAGG